MDFVVLFEEAVFALERTIGGGFVAEAEVVFLDFFGHPIEG